MKPTSIATQARRAVAVLFLTCALSGAITIVSSVMLARTGIDVGRDMGRQVDQASAMMQMATRAFSAAADVAAGGPPGRPDELFDETGRILSLLLDGGTIKGAEALQRLNNPAARSAIEHAQGELAALRALTGEMIALVSERQGAGTGADSEFHALIDAVSAEMAIADSYDGVFRGIAASVNATCDGLTDILGQIGHASGAVASASRGIADAAEGLAG